MNDPFNIAAEAEKVLEKETITVAEEAPLDLSALEDIIQRSETDALTKCIHDRIMEYSQACDARETTLRVSTVIDAISEVLIQAVLFAAPNKEVADTTFLYLSEYLARQAGDRPTEGIDE